MAASLFAHALLLASVGSAPAHHPHPPPHAAQKWWQRATSFRTVSPKCNNLTITDLLEMVEEHHAIGMKTFAINAAYSSGHGYNPNHLWCGLAMSDLRGVNEAIGSHENWQRLESAVHRRNMQLVSWINPSYFWTGSPSFKLAEKHIHEFGVNSSDIPSESPAHWFKWRSASSSLTKPDDFDVLAEDMVNTWDWVWSPKANASYLSIFAKQPSTDWSSEVWQREFRSAMTHMITRKRIDAFVFDYPDGYINAGTDSTNGGSRDALWEYRPGHFEKHITGVVRKIGHGHVGSLAEIYVAPERANEYGLDGGLGDDWNYPRFRTIAQAISMGYGGMMERAYSGPGGPDAARDTCAANASHCAISWVRHVTATSWIPGADLVENGYRCHSGAGAAYAPNSSGIMSLGSCFKTCAMDDNCTAISVQWQPVATKSVGKTGEPPVECWKVGSVNIHRCEKAQGTDCDSCAYDYSTFDRDAPLKLRLSLAAAIAGGSLPAIELDAGSAWWGARPFPGSEDRRSLSSMFRAFEQTSAFDVMASRSQVPLALVGVNTTRGPKKQYSLLRINDRDGEGAIVVFNFDQNNVTVQLNLSQLDGAVFAHHPVNLFTGDRFHTPLTQNFTLELAARDYILLGFRVNHFDATII